MKSLLFALIVSAFSFSAHADYFKCELSQGGSVLASAEAPYRVLEASVSAEGFKCDGRINGTQTQVVITDLSGNRDSAVSENGSSATAYLSTLPHHNEFNMYCTCGMN